MARSVVDDAALRSEIEGLAVLPLERLRERWRELYGTKAPKGFRREMLIRALAYQLQGQDPFGPGARGWRVRMERRPPPLALNHRQNHHRHELERLDLLRREARISEGRPRQPRTVPH